MKIFTDIPFRLIFEKSAWRSTAKLFLYRDSTQNSEAKTPNKLQLIASEKVFLSHKYHVIPSKIS